VSDAEVDVVVVGAGPTGLALALQAHDHGARVRIVERRPEPSRPSRALIVHARTLDVLRPLGVTDALLDADDIPTATCLHLGGREVRVALDGLVAPDRTVPAVVLRSQAVVETVLAGALARRGVAVTRGVTFVGGSDGGDEVVAVLDHGDRREEVACRVLVGCDGPTSTVRTLVGASWAGGAYASEAVLADLELAGPSADEAHVAVGAGGLVVLVPLAEGGTWRMVATRSARDDGGAPGRPDGAVPADEVQELLDGAEVGASVRSVPWSARVPLEHRLASRYRRGRVLVAGDAAHLHSPAGGLGMNTGIQDACNLGWKLALACRATTTDDARERLLASYEQERRPAARQVRRLTDVLFHAEAGHDPVTRLARSAVPPLAAPLVPHLLRNRRLVGVGLRLLERPGGHHRGGPLSAGTRRRARHGLRPGDRIDGRTVSVAGQHVALGELLAAPGIHVLEGPAQVPGAGAVDDPLVRSHHIDHDIGVVAVRPDGHVGYCGDRDGLASWLLGIGIGIAAGPRTSPRW
jgi:2-polyprenyl-6-methoxyphenol hydroxylase-like FAD-dependent oxidoreductase